MVRGRVAGQTLPRLFDLFTRRDAAAMLGRRLFHIALR